MKSVLSFVFFPFAVFSLFTWKWWEKQWDGNLLQKTVHVLLWPIYGTLYVILNYTHG